METNTIIKIEDSKYFWAKEYPIAYYEMDFKMALKPSALMNFLQDLATKHAEMLGFGYSFIHPKNYAWFLIKYHMEFDEYPCELNEILIKTEARGVSKILAFRDFEIWTSDNKKRLGRIVSNWRCKPCREVRDDEKDHRSAQGGCKYAACIHFFAD